MEKYLHISNNWFGLQSQNFEFSTLDLLGRECRIQSLAGHLIPQYEKPSLQGKSADFTTFQKDTANILENNIVEYVLDRIKSGQVYFVL